MCKRKSSSEKRKFKVYPSAYANMYASGVCSGKITPGGKKDSRKKAASGGPYTNGWHDSKEKSWLCVGITQKAD